VPEGDAVRRTAARLDAALAGQVLARCDLRVPRYATVDLRGMTVQGTHVVGKHMLTRLVDDRRAWTLHHHLRMDGSWRTGPVGPLRAPAHQVRVVLATAKVQAVGVRVHMVAVRETAEEDQWVGHLGPDILAEEFDADAAAARIVAAGRPLVEVLLDQRVVCGMGTIWASELAAAAGADPFAVPGAAADLVPALGGIRRRMQRSVAGARQVGPEALRVFERTGRPCRTCGTPIRGGRVGVAPMQRPTYWCPTCQAAGSGSS
jgi:endonuclease-8